MSKILINVNSKEEILQYKEIGITNFLFPLADFSIGYKTFAITEIPHDAYILINRILDTDAIDALVKIKSELCKFKGILFEDLGVYNLFKETGIELIWFQNHFATNHESINFWLRKCESAVISNEITEEEIMTILKEAKKPLILNVLGKNQIMYSRRTLLSNFNKYNNLSDYNNMLLHENTTNNTFLAVENNFGTVLYNNDYFNYIDLMSKVDLNKIKYFLILNQDLKVDEIAEIINKKEFGNDGFLHKKTVYRMSEYDDR